MTDPKWPIGKATDTSADENEAEVEGHMPRLSGGAVEQPSDDPEADAEVTGHGRQRGGVTEQPSDDPEAEVEGHGRPRTG